MGDEKEKVQEAVAAEAKAPDQMKRYVKIPARFGGRCTACGSDIKVGEPLVWDTTEKKVYCPECGLERMEAEGVDEEDD